MNRRRRERGERGEAAAMLMIVPFVFGFVLLVMFWGRQSESAQQVGHAAAVGARAGALARTRDTAVGDATEAVTRTLAASTACVGGPTVTVTASAWAPAGVVTVTVDCDVETGDLGAIGAPARHYRATGHAVIDTYRGFTP